jgi:hypothetical protein
MQCIVRHAGIYNASFDANMRPNPPYTMHILLHTVLFPKVGVLNYRKILLLFGSVDYIELL